MGGLFFNGIMVMPQAKLIGKLLPLRIVVLDLMAQLEVYIKERNLVEAQQVILKRVFLLALDMTEN